MDSILSIDIGTTSTKALLYTAENDILLSCSQSYNLLTNSLGAAEQDPKKIFQAVVSCIQNIMMRFPENATLKGIVFSSAMHSLIAIDKHNQPITPCITWADNRAYSCLNELVPKDLENTFYKKTGTPVHPMSPFAKILWLKQTNPTLFSQSAKFIGIKEYCFFQFFSSYTIDQSIASATGLFNLHSKIWDADILNFLQISETQLSSIVNCRTPFFLSNSHWIRDLKISADVPFFIGGSDGSLANYGFYQLTGQKEMLTVGTSSALRVLNNRPLLAENGETFCYMLDADNWIIGGASNNCGATLAWLQELLNLDDLSKHDFFSLAEKSTPGAQNLICLPYLLGERAPLWNPDATGSFIGMTKKHTSADFIRSMLESIVFNLLEIYQRMLSAQLPNFSSLPISGGIAQSDFFCQLVADIFNLPVVRQETIEMSSWGAACLAFEALDHPIMQSQKQLSIPHFTPQNSFDYKEPYSKFKKFQELLLYK